MHDGLTLVYAVIGAALLGIVYQARGGRALFGTRERPLRVIGAHIQLRLDDGPEGVGTTAMPVMVVDRFDGRNYHATFVARFEYEGHAHESVEFSARHAGFPVSRVGRHDRLAVNATLAGGQRFSARIVRV